MVAKDASERKNLPRPDDFMKAIYTIDIGQNDLAYSFRTLGVEASRSAIPDIINQFAASIQVSLVFKFSRYILRSFYSEIN